MHGEGNESMDKTILGNFIAENRKKKDITQKEMADAIGVSPSAVSKWECGKSFPDIELLLELAKVLDMQVEELMNCKRNEELTSDDVNDFLEDPVKIIEEINSKKLKNKNKIIITCIFLFLIVTVVAVFNSLDKPAKFYIVDMYFDDNEYGKSCFINVIFIGKNKELTEKILNDYEKTIYDGWQEGLYATPDTDEIIVKIYLDYEAIEEDKPLYKITLYNLSGNWQQN